MDLKLLVVGASARAAAWSIRRAGYIPLAADRFADCDLSALCPTTLVQPYPGGLERVLDSSDADAWMYTGALENRPSLVDRLAQRLPLLGNPGHVLRAVRDPLRLAATFRRAGIRHPAVQLDSVDLPADGSWLWKPQRSGGGTGIQPVLTDQHTAAAELGYFQQRIDGEPGSAVYVGGTGGASLIGCSRQLLGHSWNGPSQFVYAGSITRAALNGRDLASLQTLGDALVRGCGLLGVFGIDYVRNSEGIWPVEVNPRYTASVEVLERSLNLTLIDRHVDACGAKGAKTSDPPAGKLYCGKLIVYASQRLTVPAALGELVRQQNVDPDWPAIADVPQVATVIERDQPIVTVLASAATEEEVEQRLRQQMDATWRVLHPANGVRHPRDE